MRILKWLGLTMSEVESDLDEEFEFHIQERACQLRQSGLGDAEAERRARLSFGDAARFRAEAAVALSPRLFRRRMWTAVALCSCGTCAASAGLAVFVTARAHAREMGGLRSELDRLRADIAPFRGEGKIPLAQQVRFVTVRGAVRQPRVWTLPREIEVTLRTLIDKSGGVAPGARGDVFLTSGSAPETSGGKAISAAQWQTPGSPEIPLNGFVNVEVR
jgi:hypothetical protein